jgi:hypothetical protein
MTKENIKEYIEFIKHQLSLATGKQQIQHFKALLKEAKKELKELNKK